MRTKALQQNRRSLPRQLVAVLLGCLIPYIARLFIAGVDDSEVHDQAVPVALDGAESRQRECHAVGARTQLDDLVVALSIGDRRANLFNQRGARGLDGDARQDGAGVVLDGASDRAAGLGIAEPRDEQRAKQRDRQSGTTKVHVH